MPENRDTEVLEHGDIFFLYRPRVNEDDPSGAGDVQRFYIVLRPQGGPLRMLVVGRKRLPDVDRHDRHWGFVDRVTSSAKDLEEDLREHAYGTRTRGEQRLPAVRPAGEGVYVLSLEDGRMHLSYDLELPETPGAVQEAFRIAPRASFALSVKNPEKGQPRAAGLEADEKADYPQRLQEVFRDRRFAREDARLLDFEGAEIMLVGARDNPQREYGLDLDSEDEDYQHSDAVRRLRMVKSRHPVAPLFEGKWD